MTRWQREQWRAFNHDPRRPAISATDARFALRLWLVGLVVVCAVLVLR